jgi:hypothetical protein
MSENIATSAVVPAVPADDYITGVETLCGVPMSQAMETIAEIGGAACREFRKISESEEQLGKLDMALIGFVVKHDIVDGKSVPVRGDNKKYIPVAYREYMGVRQLYIGGAFDMGAPTMDAAEKVWDRAIGRLYTAGFVRPVSDDPEALRKAAARKAKAEKMAAIPDDELQAKKAELFEDGSSKAISEMKEIAKEIERRSKDANAGKVEAYKLMADAIGKRAKELAKLGTADAEDMLIKAVQVLGVKLSK